MEEKDQKEKSLLNNIKNIYNIKNLFEYLPYEKLLNVVKYSKDFQSKLNINKNTYKDYYEIEIELIPSLRYDTFIKIPDEDKKYFHIYFNNNKEETKEYSIPRNNEVEKIKIIIDPQVVSFHKLFSCFSIKKLNFIKFNRNNITDMSYMFENSYSLEEINISNIRTEFVTDMSHMFEGCSALKKLGLSNFNTDKVTNMNRMFYNCPELSSLSDISKWNTDKVTDMSGMFYNCQKLSSLPDISKWNTDNVTDMSEMFSTNFFSSFARHIKMEY